VVHDEHQFDYRYEAKSAAARDELFAAIRDVGAKAENNPKIEIFAIPKTRSLEEFTTSKKDRLVRNHSRKPGADYGEDVIKTSLEWKMGYDSTKSDDEWRGPYKIDTTSLTGKKLSIKGSINWRD